MSQMFRPAPLTMLSEGTNLAHGVPARLRGFVRKLGAGAKPIPRGTVLVLTGVQEGKHQELLLKPASAGTDAGHDGLLYVAGEYIATSYVDAADKDRQLYRNVNDSIIVDFDTTGASAGDYVYLTDAQASDGLNISLSAGTAEVAVGIVLVDDTTAGKVLVAPSWVGAKIAHLAEINKVPDLYGNMVATDTDTYAEVTAGALYDGGTLVWSLKGWAGGATSKATDWIQVSSGAGTKFRINLDAAPTGAGKSVTFSYIIKPPAA
jgi:hypothetical protein